MSDIIYGRNAVLEAFHASKDIGKVYMLSTLRGEFEVQVRNVCRDKSIPLVKVPEIKLNELTKNKIHQGIVAEISPVAYVDYKDIVATAFEQGQIPLLVLVDGVMDMRNIGAIARSSFFFGAHGLILTGNSGGRVNEDAVKTSAGAILNLPVSRANSLFTLISDLQSMRVKVIASSLGDAALPQDVDMKEPVAILLGSEDKGLHYKVLEIVDEVVKIPANNTFDSLNVSVATGILLYECCRQKKRN